MFFRQLFLFQQTWEISGIRDSGRALSVWEPNCSFSGVIRGFVPGMLNLMTEKNFIGEDKLILFIWKKTGWIFRGHWKRSPIFKAWKKSQIFEKKNLINLAFALLKSKFFCLSFPYFYCIQIHCYFFWIRFCLKLFAINNHLHNFQFLLIQVIYLFLIRDKIPYELVKSGTSALSKNHICISTKFEL